MPPKLSQYSHSPMPTPPSSPDEGEEENAIFDASEEENNNDITSALEDQNNEDEDIEDDNDESDEDKNENNESIAKLQASFQTRITILTQTLNRLTARTLAIRYQRIHYETDLTASLSNQDTQCENTLQTQLAILRLREKIIEQEIGELKAQMQALRAEIEDAVEWSDDGDDNDDGDEIMEEDEEVQEYNHEQNLDDGDGAMTEEIVEVDEDWLLNNVDNDDMEESETEEYDMMEDKN